MYVSQTYNAAGGTITGPGYVFNGTLLVTVSTASPTTILVDGTTTLATNNLPNTTIWVQGNACPEGERDLDSGPRPDQRRHILLESQNSTYTDTLSTGSGTFTNAADGTIQVTAGTGGPRTISGTVINSGTINFDTNTTFGATGVNLVNTGLINIAGATVTVVGSTLANDAGDWSAGYGTSHYVRRHPERHRRYGAGMGGTLNLTEFRLRLQRHARRRYLACGASQHADHQRRLLDLHPLGERHPPGLRSDLHRHLQLVHRSLPAASSSSRTAPSPPPATSTTPAPSTWPPAR